MSRHSPAVRTQLLFTGVVGHTFYDSGKKIVTVQLRDDRVTVSEVDSDCNILSAAIDEALNLIQDTPLVTLVTPSEIITNIPLTDKKIFAVKHLFGKEHKWIQFDFAGSQADANKLRRGTPLQVYAVNLNLPCGEVVEEL